jgi:hypothetical protein
MRNRLFGVALVALAGCGGSESGSGGTSGGGQGGAGVGAGGSGTAGTSSGVGGDGSGYGGPCVETPNEVMASQATSLGFSADDVLAITGGAHQTDLAWMMSDLYATHSRANTQTPLTFTLAPTPTAVRFIDVKGGGCPGGGLGVACTLCASRLEIDIGVTVVTGDGALNEELAVTLKTMTKDGPSFSTRIDAALIKGMYFMGIVPMAGYEPYGLHVEAGYGMSFGGARKTVPNQWNGFVAAEIAATGTMNAIMQAHGFFPRQTAGLP